MSDKIFLDTNVLVYGIISDDETYKSEIVKELFLQKPFISPQVIFEYINVARKKFKYPSSKYLEQVNSLISVCSVVEENRFIVEKALQLLVQYSLQPFDSKIVATALHNGCNILYSEDMQNGLIIEDKLRIINPFLEN